MLTPFPLAFELSAVIRVPVPELFTTRPSNAPVLSCSTFRVNVESVPEEDGLEITTESSAVVSETVASVPSTSLPYALCRVVVPPQAPAVPVITPELSACKHCVPAPPRLAEVICPLCATLKFVEVMRLLANVPERLIPLVMLLAVPARIFRPSVAVIWLPVAVSLFSRARMELTVASVELELFAFMAILAAVSVFPAMAVFWLN